MNSCVPSTCTGPTSETQWIGTVGTCPFGETGSYTWEREQIRTRTCTASTWGAWSGWGDTGATRNVVNTCTPDILLDSCGCSARHLYGGFYYQPRFEVSFTTLAACEVARTNSPWSATTQCEMEHFGDPGVSYGCYHLMNTNWLSSPTSPMCTVSPDICPAGTVPAGPIGVCKLP